MKNFLTLLAVFTVVSVARAQYVNIPDSNFRNYLKLRYPSCFNMAGEMDTSCTQIVNTTTLKIVPYSDIFKYIDGVQYFKNLDTLVLAGLNIDSIKSFPPALKYLDLSNNQLNQYPFPTIPNSVKYLNLNSTAIFWIQQLPASLEYFTASPFWGRSINSFPDSVKTIIVDATYLQYDFISFPNSLTYLEITGGGGNLPDLPANLETFICIPGNGHVRIPSLPNKLRYLDLHSASAGFTLPNLCDSLRYINLDNNYFTGQIAVLPPYLEYFSATQNQLNGILPPMPNTVRFINIQYNGITGFSGLSDSLKYLNFQYNQVAEIPSLPAGLDTLYCWGNLYHSLPSTLPASLKELICGNATFSDLPPLPSGLQTLMCGTGLRNLPALPNGLRFLGVNGNRLLTSLPRLPDSLRKLGCSSCSLTSLPDLPKPLILLNCDHNPIDFLPDLPDSMFQLLIDSTNIQCLPKIPKSAPFNSWEYPGRLYISLDANKIKCVPNLPERVSINWNTSYPLCSAVNNANHCTAFPVISGYVFYDTNSNGIKDGNEYYKSNARVELTGGSSTYTNNAGYFEIGTDSLGTYTITPTAPNYYNIVPSSATYHFTTYDTIVSKEYALQANSIKDSLAIKLTAISRARPGFSFPYLISFENAGTTSLSSNVIFNYDNTRLGYDSSSNTAVINDGTKLSLDAGNIVPGQQGSFIAYFKLKPTAIIGDSIVSKATISSGTVTAADSTVTLIRGSFDPNDKQATPQLTPLQVANGDYIDYTIRFQNTGTDTAFNIVISDTLSSDLQAGSFEMMKASHNCKTSIKNGVVYFEFLNILLPDKNINEPKSHGFVSFRIKPQSSVVENSTITNQAAIYFDYNAPVITNTAGTFIKGYSIVPLKLVSFTAVPQYNNSTSVSWSTSNEINAKNFIVEQSIDAYHFTIVATVLAKGSATNHYNSTVIDLNNSVVYYRLKMVELDGTYTLSPVIKIDRRKNTAGFNVLSNPVKDVIIINTTDRNLNNSTCHIINSQGAVVKSFVIQLGSETISIKGLPPGIYYLRTANGNNKILVQ